MRSRGMVGLVFLAFAGLPAAAGADGSVDAKRISIQVSVLPESLRETVRIEATASGAPGTWALDLVPEMEIRTATVGGRPLLHTRRGGSVVLDLSGAGSGDLALEFVLEGRPSEVFSKDRGGFVRTDIAPSLAYIRSQVAWYPRPAGDAAAYRVEVDAPKAWIVRTAGSTGEPRIDGDRSHWTFTEDRPLEEVGLVAGPYRVVEAKAVIGPTLDAMVLPGSGKGAARLLETARKALVHYGGRFGVLQGAGRFTLVEMPEAFGPGSGYGESGYALLGKGAFEDAGEAPWADSLVAHEVAHSWWGREVSFTTFASESLATYSTFGFVEETLGKDAAAAERRKSVAAVAKAAAAGKAVAFSEIRPWGRGMDPETYRVHAYDKAAMLLVMCEDVSGGRAKLDKALAGFLAANRGKRVDWADLRMALVTLGGDVPRLLEQGEAPGIPTLTLESTTTELKGKGKWLVKGRVAQEGTSKPWAMRVFVRAARGEKAMPWPVHLKGADEAFEIAIPFEPESVVLDPDARVLASVRVAGAPDPAETVKRCVEVANSPKVSDPKVLEPVVADLRRLLASGAGGDEPVCRTALGRCLFRLGKNSEAKPELEKALELGAGGPFHRAWCHLRLGCMADLAKQRKQALAHYEKARGPGASKTVVSMAERFLEKPYRGYDEDG